MECRLTLAEDPFSQARRLPRIRRPNVARILREPDAASRAGPHPRTPDLRQDSGMLHGLTGSRRIGGRTFTTGFGAMYRLSRQPLALFP